MAQHADERIQVRQVTDIHANWSEQGDGTPGKFSYQFILDNGAEEYVVLPATEDAKVIAKLIESCDELFFDLDRKILIPNGIK